MENYNDSENPWDLAAKPDIDMEIYVMSCIYLVIVGFFGIGFNVFVFAVIVKSHQLYTPFNMVLLNLVATDFIISSVGLPMDFVAAVNRGWTFGRPFCNFLGFLHTFTGICSIYTLTVLAFLRFLILVMKRQDFLAHVSIIDLHTTWAPIVIIWMISGTIALPPLLGWGHFVPESSGVSPAWFHLPDLSYGIYLMIFGFVFPLTVIVVSNYNVYHHLKGINQRRTTVVSRERRSVLMMTAMTIAFCISWTPYAIESLLIMCGFKISPTVSIFPLLFAKTSVVTDPIIYIFCNREIMKDIFQLGNEVPRLQRSRDDEGVNSNVIELRENVRPQPGLGPTWV